MKKTTPHKLSERIARYGALSLAISGISNVDGQIVHHEINPVHDDETPYLLNLNPIDAITPDAVEDSINDFRFLNLYSGTPFSNGLRVELFNFNTMSNSKGNAIIGSSSVFAYPYALNSGDVISAGNANWKNNQFQSLAFATSSNCIYGNWCSQTDKFIGLRFEINGNLHYGWAKLDASASTGPTLSWAVKEYAFNATADAPIEAGQTVLSTPKNSFDRLIISTKGKIISLSNLPQETTLRLYNISGQEVLSTKTNSSKDQINAQTVSDGIYILNLEDNLSGNTLSQKLILK